MLQAFVKLHGAPAAAGVATALVRVGWCVKQPVTLRKSFACGGGTWGRVSSRWVSAASSVASQEVESVDGEGNLDFKGTVPKGVGKARLDAWLAGQLPLVSRARVQSNIRQGLIFVNGKAITKGSHVVRQGDVVECELTGWAPIDANPEDIPLDIVYEDKHVIVINKPAHMVVHPAPGHSGGTLVNALLHHCGLPAMKYSSGSPPRIALETPDDSEESDEETDEEAAGGILTTWSGPAPVIRPGIVHRLDKGTSGLLVVAKDEYTHTHLCDQFKARSVRRSYVSLTCGVPSLTSGRVEIPIGRDPRDRKKMAAIPVSGGSSGSSKSRTAASRFRVLEVLANGGSALVEWRLETGRTHQIRVHAQYLNHPLLGDDTYGGTQGAAMSQLLPKTLTSNHGSLKKLISGLQRPCLHAITLGFQHPRTLEELNFKSAPPQDFEDTWRTLRQVS
ncbi:hypothetical protein KC19_8G167600 [Ceratodon purpureus]|uniref:RNA-binding S4 domain-containing protein n=1 Tax=Ceratodon purpureus TaxID=3225 RepID=A0A8T0GZQ5_CERPU|nr:hypothetical protein KC19_8G167600 [Ceratodon purpureus]